MQNTDELANKHGEAKSITTKTVYLLGDKLAKREGYNNLYGIDAVYFYLIQKYNWLPSQVKSMKIEDLSLCLEEENF